MKTIFVFRRNILRSTTVFTSISRFRKRALPEKNPFALADKRKPLDKGGSLIFMIALLWECSMAWPTWYSHNAWINWQVWVAKGSTFTMLRVFRFL